MEPVFITVKDFLEMAVEFSEKGMDYLAVELDKTAKGKSKVIFSATTDDIDYSIEYEFEEK